MTRCRRSASVGAAYLSAGFRLLVTFPLTELPIHSALAIAGAVCRSQAGSGRDTVRGRLVRALGGTATAGLVASAHRARTFHAELEDVDPRPAAVPYPRGQLLAPWQAWRRRDIRWHRGVEYARVEGRILRMDVTLPRESSAPVPAIVHIHGGGMLFGSRHEQGVPLLGHLAANGWAGFNIDYRHAPGSAFPGQVHDVKRAIAWIRRHADEWGVDPGFIAVTGGSAGGLLAALTALTVDGSTWQPPEFADSDVDTSVQAAIPVYGLYDLVDDDRVHLPIIIDALQRWILKAKRSAHPEMFANASPISWVRSDAPPFLVIHGTGDSVVSIAEPRRFVARMKQVSTNPVELVEIPGAQHGFDVIPSWHTISAVEAAERFLRTVYRRAPEPSAPLVSGL